MSQTLFQVLWSYRKNSENVEGLHTFYELTPPDGTQKGLSMLKRLSDSILIEIFGQLFPRLRASVGTLAVSI